MQSGGLGDEGFADAGRTGDILPIPISSMSQSIIAFIRVMAIDSGSFGSTAFVASVLS
jgi:hypothetical protein